MEEKTAKEVLIEKIWKGLVKTVASFMLVSMVAVKCYTNVVTVVANKI